MGTIHTDLELIDICSPPTIYLEMYTHELERSELQYVETPVE